MFSTMRDKAVRIAAREVLAAPSLSSRGVALRKSHIDIGFERPGEVEFRRQTETKQSYIQRPLPIQQSAAENKEKQQSLQKSSIDMAFGDPKSCKAWQTDQREKMAANSDRKFACEGRPAPIDGSRNYISGVNLGDNPVGVSDEYVTETKCKFAAPENPEQAVSYSGTIGKELQQHNWDFAMGRQKTTTQWIPAQQLEFARKAPEKFTCSKPTVDPTLAKALRQSSVFLGADPVEWPRHEGVIRSMSMPSLPRGPLRGSAGLGVDNDRGPLRGFPL